MNQEFTLHRHVDEDPYSRVRKELLSDEKLSWKSKGILSYLIGKPQGWKLRITDLVNRSSDGPSAVNSALQELRKFGYLKLQQIRKEGRIVAWAYHVADKPIFNNGGSVEVVYLEVENQKEANRGHSNNVTVTKNDLSKKEGSAEVAATPDQAKPRKVPLPTDVSEMPKPLDDPRFVQAWTSWLGSRKERRKPVSPSAARLQLAKMAVWGVDKSIKAIEQSIEQDWTGIFEPKTYEKNRPNRNVGIAEHQSQPGGGGMSKVERVLARRREEAALLNPMAKEMAGSGSDPSGRSKAGVDGSELSLALV